MLKRRRISEKHGFLPYDYYAGYNLEGQELFDAVRIGDEMWEVGTEKVAASSSGTRRFTVADRTAKRIYITDGYSNYTITPNTVENDLFYYKHFNTKHYLSWVSKSIGMSRPDKPKKSTRELPGKRKALSNTELNSSRWFGGLLPNGYASITEGHFIYYSKTDEMDDLVSLVGGQNVAKIPGNTPMSDPGSILQDVKFVTSLDKFTPLKSTKQSDWLGVDFDALEDENYVYGGFSEKCFKTMKKFFKAEPSQIKVGLAKKSRKFFLILSTQDKKEVGMIILNPLNAFEGRKRFESVSCRKIRGTYSSEQRRLPLCKYSVSRRRYESHRVNEYNYSEAMLFWCADGKPKEISLRDLPGLIRKTFKPINLPLSDTPVPDYALYVVPSYATPDKVCHAASSQTTTDEDTGKQVMLDMTADTNTWIRRIMDAGDAAKDCMLSFVFRLKCSTGSRAYTTIDIACETDLYSVF